MSSPGSAPGAVEGPGGPPPPGGVPTSARLGGFALAAGLLAGLVSWGIGEAVVEQFPVKTHTVQGMGGPMTVASNEEIADAQYRNAALAYGILGAVAGLAFGLAGGLARSAPRPAAVAAAAGLVLGAAAGAGASLGVVPSYYRFADAQQEKASANLIVPLLVHGTIWGAIGVAGGVAFALGAGRTGRAARAPVGGLIGALAGTAVYELAGALAFPLDRTVEPLSQGWASRLLARSAVALLVGAGIALVLAAGDRPRRAPRDAPRSERG